MTRAASLTVLGLFFVVMHWLVLPPHGFLSGDQGPKYLQARAFASLQTGIDVRSHDLDPEFRFQDPILRNRNGRLVATFSWLMPILVAPFLAAFGLRGLYVVPALAAGVIFLVAAALGRRLGEGSGLWAAWVAVLTAPVLFYGLELWEHTPAAAAAMLVALCLAPGAPARGFTAGVCAAIGALFREEAFLALPAFLIARAISVDRDQRRALFTVGARSLAGAAAVFLLSVPMNVVTYGSLLPLHVTSEVSKTSAYWEARGTILRTLFAPALTPDSVFYTWPFLIALIFLPLVPLDDARRRGVRFLGAGAALIVAGTLAIVPSAGGAQWSPRYLFAAAPLLAILASIPARRRDHRDSAAMWAWAARAVLLGAIVVQGIGLAYLADAKARNARTTDRLRALVPEDEPVITDIAWFPEVTATLAPTRRLLLAWSPDEVGEIAARAAAAGFRRISVVTSTPETRYTAPERFATPAGCVFTRKERLSLIRERALIVHRYVCGASPVVK